MKPLFRRPIRKQFQLVLYGLLAVGLLLSLLCYSVIDRLMMKNAEAYASNTAQKFNSEVEFLFDRADALFNSLLFDETIEEMLHTPFSARTPAYLSALHSQFTSFSLMNQDLAEIALVSDEVAWSNYFDAATLRRFSAQLAGTYGARCFGLYASPLISQKNAPMPRLIFGHNVYGMHDPALYGEYLGCILLSLDLSKSPVTLPADDRSTSVCFFLADQNGTVFSFSGSEALCTEILALTGAAPSDEPFETTDYLVYVKPIEGTGLSMVSAMDRHELRRDVLWATVILIGITLATLGLILGLMYLILRSIVHPLSCLSRYIDTIRSVPLQEDRPALQLDGCEEIVAVGRSFNGLLDRQLHLNRELQQATVKLYETRLGYKQAELDYLRSQINPHFLYNTLETIQAMAVEQRAPEIGDAAGALGKLLRHTVKGAAVIPLAEELEITRAYLTIQKLRFPERLKILECVRENTRTVPVMKLLLQPLVENAIVHGIEPKTGPGTVYLGARLEGGDLVLCVYDDGVGIAPDRLRELQARLAAPPAGRADIHLGLWNVHNRIRLHYGEAYGLTLTSTPGEGTQVALRLPAAPHTQEE